MAGFEYKVVPAPAKGTKAKGVKAVEDRFALTVEELLNEMGAQGWEYQRADTLPSIERSGLTGSTTNWRHVLVFRRSLEDEVKIEPQYVENQRKLDEIKEEITADPEPEQPKEPVLEDDPKPLTATRDSDV